MLVTSTGLFLGLVLGMRHALEPDHLAAVSTLVVETKSARDGAMLGALWGVGHTASLVLVALAVANLELAVPPQIFAALELVVSGMLIYLGARAIRRALREGRRGTELRHTHGGHEHVHRGPETHVHLGRHTLARRPLFVGLLHGLAGSGALTALVLTRLPTTPTRLGFVVLFGLGSVVGMSLLSAAAGLPLARLARHPAWARGLGLAAGVMSISVGVFWAWSSR